MAETRQEDDQELLELALSMPHGDARQSVLDEAVRLADASNDLRQAYGIRLQMLRDSVHFSRPEKFLPAFTWCLHQLKQDREQFGYSASTITWAFKYMMLDVISFPEISLKQWESLAQEMKDWYQQEGFNQRPVLDQISEMSFHRGDFEETLRLKQEMYEIERDRMANCAACETDHMVEIYSRTDQNERALEAAKPLLDRTKTCLSVPHRTYGNVLRPLAKLGRYEEADSANECGYRMMRKDSMFLIHITPHIFYLLHRQNFPRALALVERHLPWAMATNALDEKFMFWLAFRRTLEKLLDKKGGRKTRQLKLPAEFPLYQADGKYFLPDLLAWVQAEESELAVRFDRRNGTDNFSRQLPEHYNY